MIQLGLKLARDGIAEGRIAISGKAADPMRAEVVGSGL